MVELQNNLKLENALKHIEPNLDINHHKSLASKGEVEIDDFVILTNTIIKLTKGTTETYTFQIEKFETAEKSSFANFMIQKNVDSYQFYLFKYIKNKKFDDEFQYNIEYNLLNNDLVNISDFGDLQGKLVKGMEVPNCVDVSYVSCSKGGNADGHPPAEQTDGTYCSGSDTILDFAGCQDDSGGGNLGTGGGIPPGNEDPNYNPTSNTIPSGNSNIPIVTSPINPDGSSAVVDMLTNFLSLTSIQSNYLTNNITVANKIFDFLEQNNSTQDKNLAKEGIDALILNIPVIFNIETENVYQGNPLNFNTLTSEQKIAVVVYALKKAVNDNAVDYFDIHQLFYNLPTVDVDVVGKIPVGGKLLDVRIIFGVYSNLQINDFPNNGKQYGPLSGVVGNYIIDGYWWTLKFKSYGAAYGNGAESLWITVKQKGQYDFENGTYFENYLGY